MNYFISENICQSTLDDINAFLQENNLLADSAFLAGLYQGKVGMLYLAHYISEEHYGRLCDDIRKML